MKKLIGCVLLCQFLFSCIIETKENLNNNNYNNNRGFILSSIKDSIAKFVFTKDIIFDINESVTNINVNLKSIDSTRPMFLYMAFPVIELVKNKFYEKGLYNDSINIIYNFSDLTESVRIPYCLSDFKNMDALFESAYDFLTLFKSGEYSQFRTLFSSDYSEQKMNILIDSLNENVKGEDFKFTNLGIFFKESAYLYIVAEQRFGEPIYFEFVIDVNTFQISDLIINDYSHIR